MPDFVTPEFIGIAAGIVVILLLIAVAPKNVADAVGQVFQLLGRLVAAVAGEAELGATALFGIVAGVFNARPPKPAPTPTPAAQTPGQSTAVTPTTATGQATTTTQATPAASTTTTTTTEEEPEELKFSWIAETIFTRLLYLVTVAIIVASDFVFSILRLQAVLFPSLEAPIKDLSFLSLLTGGLLVSIVLLTGALTLDFLDILPRPVRLFPNISERLRVALFFFSLFSLLLALAVVGALFLQGQLLTSLSETSPAGAVALAAALGILQVLVVFLGAWGALRGLAIILALVGGAIGIVLHLIAIVLEWLSQAFDLIGTSILADLIWGIAAIFGRKRPGERIPRTGLLANVLSVVGYGDRSSSFTATLVQDLTNMYGRAGLLAVGTYAEESAVNSDVQARFGRIGVNNISPLLGNDPNPLGSLKSQVLRAYQGKRANNKMALWIVDGELAAQCADTLAQIKRAMPDLSITVLCLLPPGGVRGADPFTQLKALATEKKDGAQTAITTTIMIDDRSPMYRILGEPAADRLVARSLSGMLLAPLHNTANPSFVNVVRALNDAGQAFSALAIDSVGIVTGANGAASQNRTTGSGSVSTDLAFERTQTLATRMLTGASSTTVQQGPTSTQPALYLNFIVPLAARSAEAVDYRGQISNWLADTYSIYLYGVVDGEGVDLSDKNPGSTGDRYMQVGILYGIGDTPPQTQGAAQPAAQTRVVEAGN